jgi:hypothetical protein
VVGFSESVTLFRLHGGGELDAIPLPAKEVTALMEMGAKVEIGYTGSGNIRLLSIDGREEAIFVGHSGDLTNLQKDFE